MAETHLEAWKALILIHHPLSQFTKEPAEGEPGEGKTYGDDGDWTAHVGPDMQADVVGVYNAADDQGLVFTGADGSGEVVVDARGLTVTQAPNDPPLPTVPADPWPPSSPAQDINPEETEETMTEDSSGGDVAPVEYDDFEAAMVELLQLHHSLILSEWLLGALAEEALGVGRFPARAGQARAEALATWNSHPEHHGDFLEDHGDSGRSGEEGRGSLEYGGFEEAYRAARDLLYEDVQVEGHAEAVFAETAPAG